MNETWLTQDAYDKLKAELAYLSGELREEIRDRIAAAREEGDLKENGGYHAAREEQGKNEARIKQLAAMLETAHIGTPPAGDGTVSQGMVVTVEFIDFGDVETFLLGSREQNAHVEIDVYSATSELGKAVLGQAIGADVSYAAPNGKTINIRIVDATPYAG